MAYFTDAAVVLYQFDPFHMVKDLRVSLANQPEVPRKALAAYRDSRVEDLLTHLHAAFLSEEDEQKKADIGGLLADV